MWAGRCLKTQRENPQKCKAYPLQAPPDPAGQGPAPSACKFVDAIWVTILSAPFLMPSPITEGTVSLPRTSSSR